MVNPLGAIVVFDGEVPRTFTATAAADISGGQLVVCNGTANTVGSDIASYVTTDISATQIKTSDYVNGIALQNASSGTNSYVTVATRGAYLMRCGGIVSGGQLVSAASGTIQWIVPMPISGTGTSGTVGYSSPWLAPTPIGRALTPSASGTNLYTLVSLNV
jgi:hypothetical protein